MKRRGGDKTRAKMAGKTVRIWSDEHRAYWGPDYAGYTTLKANAGVFSFEAAWLHTNHCGPEKKIIFEVTA